MTIDPLFLQPVTLPAKQSSNPVKRNESFGQLLNQSLKELNNSQKKADETIKQFLTGDIQDLHQVSIALGEAKLAMQLAVQVRNKLLEAYQEMMRMQV